MQVAVSDDRIRGVTRRNALIWALFRALARGDFKHDFGEGADNRDRFTLEDYQRFFEIAKLISTKGNVWLRTRFQTYVGKTIFEFLKDSIDTILPAPPPGGAADPTFYDEETLLRSVVGVDYQAIKNAVSDPRYVDGSPLSFPFTIPGFEAPRSYTIRSTSYRLGPRGTQGYSQNQNVATMFRKVTGGKNKFVLIVDASGGLPLSELLNTSLEPYRLASEEEDPRDEFYIIENIENATDSATKISEIKKKEAPGRPAPTLRFLSDTENTVVYPLWDTATDPKSNIYSSLKIVLNRVNGIVEANIILVDKDGNTVETFQIGDVSNASNVKNASLRALATLLEKGAVPETLVYTLIKRMGDWCQALSMLDLDRVYQILDESRNSTGAGTTLRNLLIDSEVGVVTNDRILLALCIMLGLNVYFTTAMDIARLIYFKNDNDLPVGSDLITRAQGIYNQGMIPSMAVPEHRTEINTAITAVVASIAAETNIAAYIYKLKAFASNIGRLRNEFELLLTRYQTLLAEYAAAATDSTGQTQFRIANAIVGVATKITADIQYNRETLKDLAAGVYPGSSADRIRLDALARKLASGGRITKSVEVTEAKEMLLATRDDLAQVQNTGLVSSANLLALLGKTFAAGNDRVQVNYNEIMSVIPTLQLTVSRDATGGGRRQRGGGNSNFVFERLRARSIRVLDPTDTEVTSTINIYKIGDSYIDQGLNQFTVADEYIVTYDEFQLFNQFFEKPEPGTEPDADLRVVTYIALRSLLLEHDSIFNALEKLRTDLPASMSIILGTVEHTALEELFNRINQLQVVLQQGVHPIALAVAIRKPDSHIFVPLPTQRVDPSDPGAFLADAALAQFTEGLRAIRTRLIQLIQTIAPSNAGESAETLRQEQAIEQAIEQANRIIPDGVIQAAAGAVLTAYGYRPRTTTDYPELAELASVLRRAYLEVIPVNTVDPESPTLSPDIILQYPGIVDAFKQRIAGWLKSKGHQVNDYILSNIGVSLGLYMNQLRTNRGGFQGRRGLYSNAGTLSSGGSRPGLYAGLRKRPEPRRTARVRQHTGGAQTRRQRLYMDRVRSSDTGHHGGDSDVLVQPQRNPLYAHRGGSVHADGVSKGTGDL